MKFKDLEIGQKFRMKNGNPGVVQVKIKPEKSPSVLDGWLTHKDIAMRIRGGWVRDDDDVIPVK